VSTCVIVILYYIISAVDGTLVGNMLLICINGLWAPVKELLHKLKYDIYD